MHILIISECYPTPEAPQYGIFVKQQADALKALGNTFDVLIPQNTGAAGELQMQDDEGCYRISYRLFRYNLFPRIAAKKYYEQVYKLLAAKCYDAVSVHITSDAILQLTVVACNKLNIPVVAHYHGLNVWEEFTSRHPHREKWYAHKREKSLRGTQAIVGVSQKVTDIIRTRLPEKPPSYTVYNGVDVQKFTPAEKVPGVFRIIGVGNLIPIKGFSYLIQAFARLYGERDDISLHIIGQGSQREKLEALARELGVGQKVTFYGNQPYDTVARVISGSDLFVLPSYYEALGCVYLEAMACGVPAIGVEGMGIDEIITDGEDGYLVNPCDADDLYKKMKQALSDPAALTEIGKAAYKTAQNYTWEASAKRLNDIYQGLVKQ